ncbi:6638_t:CDS:2, partial [Racocetra fulgida]
PFVHSLDENFNKLKESKKITNIHDCQIFASIMNKEFRDIFSIRVEYEDKGTPLIIAHHITSIQNMKNRLIKIASKKDLKLKIGWIIVGYPETFDFDNTEMILRSSEHTVSEEGDRLVAEKIPGYLCTCVIAPNNDVSQTEETSQSTQAQVVSDSNHNPFDSKLIIVNFLYIKLIFIPYIDQLDLYSTVYKGNFDQISEWKKLDKNIFCADFPDKNNFKSPILVNQLVKNCSNNCQQYHGFLNVGSKNVIYGPLDPRPSEIFYLVVPKIN